MNYVKIAAALHALAEAFEGEDATPAKGKGRGKAAAAEQPAAAAPAAAPVTGGATAGTPPSTPPPAPTIDKAKLNAAVLKVAAKSRDTATSILAKFGAQNTVTLAPELWQAVYDAFEEEIAKMDAAAVQVAQASLV
jgi:hypothetical protein